LRDFKIKNESKGREFMRKILFCLTFIFLFFVLASCGDDENPLENVDIEAINQVDIPEGIYEVPYTIADLEDLISDFGATVTITAVDENNQNVTVTGRTFEVEAGKVYTVTIKLNAGIFTKEKTITVTAVPVLQNYTITFLNFDGTLLKETTHQQGENISTYTLPDAPSRIGYSFSGWSMNLPTVMPNQNLTVQATFTINQYTISFETNEGSIVNPITQNYGTTVNQPQNPTKEGYTFVGWFSNANLTLAYSFTTMPAENITLYAKWEVNTYTIMFKDTDGTVIQETTHQFNANLSSYVFPDEPNKTGYTFSGWSRTLPQTMPAENITIEATYSINTYTLSFETNGGTLLEDITLSFGSAIDLPNNPTKEGHTFQGWYLDPQWTEMFSYQTMPARDLTVYALWSVNSYNLSFETDGGSEVLPMILMYDQVIPQIDEPTKEGYIFAGWFLEPVLMTPFTYTNMPAQHLTVYAKWNIGQYTISFDSNEGSEVAPITLDYQAFVNPPENPTREGFEFMGWFIDQELLEAYIFDTMPAENITLYAKWMEIEDVKVNHFFLRIKSQTENQVVIEVVLGGEVDINGYDLRVYYDASIFTYASHVNNVSNVINPTNPGVIIFNFVELFNPIQTETVILTITFNIIGNEDSTMNIEVIEASKIDEYFQPYVVESNATGVVVKLQ
jgi:uncharacterized repeat protein (TIGR02543 family)